MNKHLLSAQKRLLLGRKTKSLRKQGILPGSVFGKDVTSVAISVDLKEFLKLEKEVGETGLIYLDIKEDSQRPVLIRNIQFHPVSETPLHVDFQQVNLKEAITARVPVILTGESAATISGQGILIQLLSEIEVEALPTDLPEKIELDISSLTQVDQALHVKDLKVDSKIKILTDLEEIIAKVNPLAKEEVVEAPTTTEEQTPAPVEGEASATPTEGETTAPAE